MPKLQQLVAELRSFKKSNNLLDFCLSSAKSSAHTPSSSRELGCHNTQLCRRIRFWQRSKTIRRTVRIQDGIQCLPSPRKSPCRFGPCIARLPWNRQRRCSAKQFLPSAISGNAAQFFLWEFPMGKAAEKQNTTLSKSCIP